MNPISWVRRLFGLGAVGLAALFGAKSWLDSERAQLRWTYYQEMAVFWEALADDGCLSRETIVDTAMSLGWSLRETRPSCGAAEALRLIPSASAPWIPGEDGFVMRFDAKGCRIEAPDC